jgi:hypothetical protein
MVFVGMPGFSLNPRVNDDERAILQKHFDEIHTLRRVNQKADELDEWAAQLFKSGLFSQEARAELSKCAKTLRGILRVHGHKLYLFAPAPYEVSHARNEPVEEDPMQYTDDDMPAWTAAEEELFLPFTEGEAAEGPEAPPALAATSWLTRAKNALTGGRHE